MVLKVYSLRRILRMEYISKAIIYKDFEASSAVRLRHGHGYICRFDAQALAHRVVSR
jgi:hypothetical protein